jgi:hypothetical protein
MELNIKVRNKFNNIKDENERCRKQNELLTEIDRELTME